MELIKQEWHKKDIKEFNKFLLNFKNENKINWTKNLLKTQYPVLAIRTQELRKISNQIFKGNYISFLDLNINDYYENGIINALLICKIKDVTIQKKYLDLYSTKIDSWGTCDILKFNIKNNESYYKTLIQEYIYSKYTFQRRIAIIILFEFIKNKEHLPFVFNILNKLYNEKEYYVNMAASWLICECFIKHKTETLDYLNNNCLNDFTINKAIQKCRESYRVIEKDKNLLLNYKRVI